MIMIYIVWYNEELMAAFKTLREAQDAVNAWAEGMHPENAADLVIQELKYKRSI